jgi:hypothetical protein
VAPSTTTTPTSINYLTPTKQMHYLLFSNNR